MYRILLNIWVPASENNPPYVNTPVDSILETVGFNVYELDASNVFIDTEGEPLTYKVEIINEAKGWQRSFVIYGVAAVIFFLVTFKGTRERVQPPKAQKSSWTKDIKELAANGPWVILLLTTITFILFVAVRSSVTAHYFKYVIGSQELSLPFFKTKTYSFETLVSAFNTIGQISSLLGVFIVNWIAKIIGKKKAFIIIFLIAVVSTVGILFPPC